MPRALSIAICQRPIAFCSTCLRPNTESQEPAESIDAITRGRFIHEILEFNDFVHNRNRETVISQALQNQHLTDPNGDLRKLGEGILNGLQSHPEIRAWFSDPTSQNRNCLYAQIRHLCSGSKIDRLNANPPVIIDYKTHDKPPAGGWAKLATRYDFQMACDRWLSMKPPSQIALKPSFFLQRAFMLFANSFLFRLSAHLKMI